MKVFNRSKGGQNHLLFSGEHSATRGPMGQVLHAPRLAVSQSGSIMLEVVAVLALMGVMGAMLFRQIYQRNQELHNIQMASEIRTVKEAFSAYIQANKASILGQCNTPTSSADIEGCTITDEIGTEPCDSGVGKIYCNVAEYLPDGWFTGSTLESAYRLTLWNYLQDDGSGRRVVYGVVVPTSGTLPATGWNFRRAARVALLIGADGGAYDHDITDGKIAGSLGAWELDATGTGIDPTVSTYAAMTGIDVFAPEPGSESTGEANLPEDLSLALNNLHAYGHFSAGNKGAGNCYNIEHYRTTTTPGDSTKWIKSDLRNGTLSADCQPLFWVGSGTGANAPSDGNVYVATDLNIGEIVNDGGTLKHNEALKLTKEGEIVQKDGLTVHAGGVIKQKEGLTIDADGRIVANDTVAANVGDLKGGEQFVVDPAYTSTMNDIRLTSRGGARLSDILPNYILKIQGRKNSGNADSCEEVPTCPKDYTKALVVIPTSWDKKGLSINMDALAAKLEGSASVPSGGGTVSVTINREASATTTQDVDNDTGLCVWVAPPNDVTMSGGNVVKSGFVPNGGWYENSSGKYKWCIRLGRREGDACVTDASASGIYQIYCVWTPSLFASQVPCEKAGYTWNGSACTDTRTLGAERYQTPEACGAAGLYWDGSRCENRYNISNISSIADDAKKKAACQAAGWVWNGSTCTCPSGKSGNFCT